MKVLKIAALIWVTLFTLLGSFYSLIIYLGGIEAPYQIRALILITTYATIFFMVVGYAIKMLTDLL